MTAIATRCSLLLIFLFLTAAGAELDFQYVKLDNRYYLYERDVGDIDGDWDNDIVGVQEGQMTVQVFRAPTWVRSTLITFTGSYRYPRADDFKLADINNDGKLDVVTRLGPGAFDDGPGIAVWYENLGGGSGFMQHWIGNSPEYVKDIVVADFDQDDLLDVAMRMDSRTQVWLQEANGSWTEVLLTHAAHEGMEAGDLNGDGRPDIILNGFWFQTPTLGEEPRDAAKYTYRVIDKQWFNQGGDWTADSCKVVVGDFDGDGAKDVAFSHSEQPRFAVTWYRSLTPNGEGPWEAHPVTVVDYCHNLQAADFDLDGDDDLLVGGMIQSQHKGLKLMLNQGWGTGWVESPIQSDGSYSAELGDLDEDGDWDIVGIFNWDRGPSWFYRNTTRDVPPSDTTKPTIASVTAVNGTTVQVLFSEPVEEVSAETTGNYAINNGVTILSAMLGADARTVTLTTSALVTGNYLLTVNNVTDRATVPNPILPDSQAAFSFTADTTQPTITSVKAVNGTTVQVLFSEPVEEVSAETTGNYAINNGVTILSAVLGADARTVTLTTSALATGNYLLTATGVVDLAGNPSNATAPFSYRRKGKPG